MALLVEIKVVPSAGKQLWKLDKNGMLKCYLKSPAEQGQANDELVERLAKVLKIPRSAVTIITGATSRLKKIKIDHTITLDQLLGALGIERQLSLM